MTSLEFQPISVKSVGRTHLACLRCRNQKIKCSGDNPVCRNCAVSGKECRYPKRDRKVIVLESQLQKMQSRLRLLEAELKQAKGTTGLSNPAVNSPGDSTTTTATSISADETAAAAEGDTAPAPVDSHSHSQTPETDPEPDLSNLQEFIDPFEKSNRSVTGTSDYFGTSSCQTFDSSLHAFLFQVTRDSVAESDIGRSCRHFFHDPEADSPFPGVVMLPEKEYARFLIGKVLEFIGHEYFLLDTTQFLTQVDQAYATLSDKKPMWLCYFFVCLAVGEQYMNRSSYGEPPGMRFYIPAMKLFRENYEEPSLEYVQTLTLIAFYQQGLNRANTVFSYYGLAMRSALILGLHRKVTDPKVSAEEKEKRKRVWWTLFVMETIWCAKLGQPIHISTGDIDVGMPNEDPVDLHDGFNNELLQYNVQLASIICNILRKVYGPSAKTGGINVKGIIQCLDELDSLQQSLPLRIKHGLLISDNRSTANFYLRLNQSVIITARPLVLSIFKGLIPDTQQTRQITQKCVNAAKINIDLLVNLKNNGWVSTFGFWDAQYCFSSILILIMSSLMGNSYTQTQMARTLNTYMKNAGNFTAKDNDARLDELDRLLAEIYRKKTLLSPRTSHWKGSCPNGGEGDAGDVSKFWSWMRDRAVVAQSSKESLDPAVRGSETIYNSASRNVSASAPSAPESRASHAVVEGTWTRQSQSVVSPVTAIINDIISNFSCNSLGPQEAMAEVLESEKLSGLEQSEHLQRNTSGTAGFKGQVSPSTWNDLTLNLQFWDSSNIPLPN